MTQYVVTAPCLVHVPFDTPQGKQLGTLYTHAVLPASVPDEKIKFWLDAGMIEKVEGESAVQPAGQPPETSAPDGQPEQNPEPKAPPESGPGSSKDAWVEYAVASGRMERADAEALSKTDLVTALKGETPGE
jgi:hypothetical protein